MSSQPVLEINNLTCRFGTTDAVRGVSLDIHEGETLAVLGESGSKKRLVVFRMDRFKMIERGNVNE